MSSGWNFEVLCLCHWQIMHDLSSNSPSKLECSVLGFKCQLIRTQICWEIKKCKMFLGYSLLYPDLLRVGVGRTGSRHLYRSGRLFSACTLQLSPGKRGGRGRGTLWEVCTYPMKWNRIGMRINGGEAEQLAACTDSFLLFLWLTWKQNSEQHSWRQKGEDWERAPETKTAGHKKNSFKYYRLKNIRGLPAYRFFIATLRL